MSPAAQQCVLAIDLGTSGPKAALVGSGGRLLATARASVKTIHLPDRGIEQDPREIWDAVKQACKQVLSASGVNSKTVAGIICSSQYSSIVPVDKHGEPTMNMILWLDQRGDRRLLGKCDGFPRRVDSPLQMWRWLRVHGMPPLADGSESMSHMRWVKFARPEIYEETDKFLEPMDYLTLKFTGRPTANQSTMFMSLLIDNRALNVTQYDRQLVAHSLIDLEKLPELLPLDAKVGTVRPEVADELGLSSETIVFTGLNDTQSGGMATYAFTGDHAGLSVGSSSVIITHVPKKKSDIFNALLTMPSPVPDTYFIMAENGVAGGGLEHFLRHIVFASDHFGEISQADEFEALNRAVASVAPGSDKVLFLPWLTGSIAPSPESHMRGGILNLSVQTTRSHMARAVLEGVALNLRWLHEPVQRFVKRSTSHFIYYGGGAESDEWSQIMADVLGRPVHQMADPQYATCLGAGLLACQRLGFLGFDDFANSVAIKRVYEPQSKFQATYDELFEQFVAAFRANRKMFRKLNAKTSPD